MISTSFASRQVTTNYSMKSHLIWIRNVIELQLQFPPVAALQAACIGNHVEMSFALVFGGRWSLLLLLLCSGVYFIWHIIVDYGETVWQAWMNQVHDSHIIMVYYCDKVSKRTIRIIHNYSLIISNYCMSQNIRFFLQLNAIGCNAYNTSSLCTIVIERLHPNA